MSFSVSQARVVDPVLTTHAQGYKHPERVGGLLFPTVPVNVSAGKIIEFGQESFVLYNARRAAGAATKRMSFGYEGKPFLLVQDSLENKVAREMARDAKAVPGIDLGMRATNVVMQSLSLGLEYEQARIATDPANYDAGHKRAVAAGVKWDTATGNPIGDIDGGRQAIRRSCGLYPNTMILGPAAYAALKSSPQVVARFKNSDIVTSAMLAALFELKTVVEGRAVVSDGAGTFEDVWGNAAVLAYAPENPGGPEEPSYGYTYAMAGHPFVEPPYWDGNAKSFIYGVTYERAAVLTGMSAGYLIEAPATEAENEDLFSWNRSISSGPDVTPVRTAR